MYVDEDVDEETVVEFKVAMWVGLCFSKHVKKAVIDDGVLYGLEVMVLFGSFYNDFARYLGFTIE